MSSIRRAVVLVVFGTFALTLVLRPVSRFLTTGFTGEGFDTSVLFLALPGLIVALVMLAVGLSVLTRTDENSETSITDAMTVNKQREVGDGPPPKSVDVAETVDERADGSQDPPSFLSGQGGTRNKGFEIEEQPPETAVDDHLQYLREQLGEESIDVDSTETLSADDDASVDTSGEPAATPEIPAECPQQYCDANWKSGGLLRVGSENYEILDDGNQVRCESCGSIATLK